MLFNAVTIASLLALGASASPTPTVEKRAAMCGQWDSVATGTYTLYNNLWGQSAATSGSQCTTFNSLSGSTLAWSTSWTWAGGATSVKSYANAVLKQATGIKLSTIKTIPSKWKWSYTGTSMVANVAYDLFTSSTPTGSEENEIMIWLAGLGGAGPISSTGSAIATPTIAGVKWNLFKGPNGQMTVYSFVASSQVTSFDGDVNLFLAYLSKNQGLSTSQYLKSLGAGTEPFVGSKAVLTTTAYSAAINV